MMITKKMGLAMTLTISRRVRRQRMLILASLTTAFKRAMLPNLLILTLLLPRFHLLSLPL